ncbi:hypothetical protein KUTeg_007500 [Tegillarca granosa]|uniref:G-protein coupled receptors family 1 profile domain-containing protein n=1 Tax=Tegillarca granosa TaxID=220873 RepID=A0ABQ9FDF6_TEGGR|nr:hypothetical protein KUTeg_007500 [Tegillarca granosa]
MHGFIQLTIAFSGLLINKPIHICRYELIFSVAHVIVLFVIQLFLPLGVMLSLYVRIARIARKQAKIMAIQSIRPQSRNSRNIHIHSHELKSTILVSILLSCFALGWLPMIVYFFYSVICPECYTSPYIRASVRILLYINSAINIFIYAGRLSDFRAHIKTDLKKCFHSISSRFKHAKPQNKIQRRSADSRASQIIILTNM